MSGLDTSQTPKEFNNGDLLFGSLSAGDQSLVYKLCILVFILSRSKFIPHELQLSAALAEYKGLDYEVNSGTSTGKLRDEQRMRDRPDSRAQSLHHFQCQQADDLLIWRE